MVVAAIITVVVMYDSTLRPSLRLRSLHWTINTGLGRGCIA